MNKFKNFLRAITPISDKEYEDAIPYFLEQNLKKGDFFVQQDKVCREVAFIVKGTLRVYYLNEKFEETTSCFCTENNFTTSYKSFVLQEPSTLILQAIEDTQLLVIEHDNLEKLYSNNTVWQTIGRVIAQREYIVMEQYASILSNETGKEKYLRLLKEQPNVLQIAKIEHIASYLGVTRRTLSRIRQEVSKQPK